MTEAQADDEAVVVRETLAVWEVLPHCEFEIDGENVMKGVNVPALESLGEQLGILVKLGI